MKGHPPNTVVNRLCRLSVVPPKDSEEYGIWLEQADAIEFLERNATDDEFVAYASLPHTFIHAAFVPITVVTPPDIDDLTSWSCNPYSSWSVVSSKSKISVEPPLAGSSSKSLAAGEQLVFVRGFEGVQERRNYIEILQKFVHVSGIHHMPERNAWCRLNRHGDIEDLIRVIKIPERDKGIGGTIVIAKRGILEMYAALTNAAILRMFDFTRFRPQQFGGWHNSINEENRRISHLPYEEQLHWKQYNEPPKAPISKRAFTTDFEGQIHREYNPLASLKHKLQQLQCPWWTLRGERVISRAHYPVTSSNDEWREEILNLDQLLVEGFEEKWLRKKASELGRSPDIKFRSLKLLEECLVGLGFDKDHALSIIAPLRDLHDHRTKLKGHVSDDSAATLKSEAIKNYGNYRRHYEHLAQACDEALMTLITAFTDSRMT